MCRRCCAAVPEGAGVCQDRPGCGVHAYPTQPRQPCPPHPATTRAGTRRQHHARCTLVHVSPTCRCCCCAAVPARVVAGWDWPGRGVLKLV